MIGLEPLTCSLRVSRSRPLAIEVLTLTILAPQLHQHQLDLGGFLVQQGAEAEGRKFLGSEPTWTCTYSAEPRSAESC
jgi:hypothetical protein